MKQITPPLSPSNSLPLKDIRGPVPIHVLEWKEILLAGGIVLIILLLLAGLLWWRGRKNQLAGPTCDQVALDRLHRAREYIPTGDAEAFAAVLSDILRTYIQDRFHLRPHQQTTREFITSLTAGHDQIPRLLVDNRSRLVCWLQHCDLAKFARSSLSSQVMEEMADNLEQFIRATRPAMDARSGEHRS